MTTIIISLSVVSLIVTIYLSIRIVMSGIATLLEKRKEQKGESHERLNNLL